MADRHPPTVPVPVAGSTAPAREIGPSGPGESDSSAGSGGSGRGAGDERSGGAGRSSAVVLAGAALATGGLILALGVAALVGERVRSAVLVEVDRSPVASEPSYSDAPAEAAAFFAERDSVTVRVPRDMTAGDFLSLYHLETNAAARAALRDQLGAVADGDVLREGDQVTLTVTLPRGSR